MQKILKQLGINSKFKNDTLSIQGKILNIKIKIKVSDLGDHRICMSAAILGLLSGLRCLLKTSRQWVLSPNF